MAAPVQVGQILAGRYRVDRILGEGGMGIVLGATRLGIGDRVAIKVLLHDVAQGEERVARFLREAQATARIQSDHVVRILDVGSIEGGQPFIAMDLLEGEDLEQRLTRGGPMPAGEAAALLAQVCDAIAAAHRAGIVHRDLKPANVFLTARGAGDPLIKVLDFGISKLTDAGDLQGAPMTATSSVMGSPAYMSPEQLRSTRDVDGRTDLWSIGTIAFELVTGRSPFDRPSLAELCSAILVDPTPSLATLRPDVDPAYAAIVERCLAKDRARRVASADELAAAFRAVPRRARDDDDEAPTRMRHADDEARIELARTAFAHGGLGPPPAPAASDWEQAPTTVLMTTPEAPDRPFVPGARADAGTTATPAPPGRAGGWWILIAVLLAIGAGIAVAVAAWWLVRG